MAKTKRRSEEPEELDLDDELDGIDEAEVRGSLPKIKAGKYIKLVFDKVSLNPNGHFGKNWTFELQVAGGADNGHRRGTKVRYTILGFDERNRRDMAMENLKAIVAAAFGKDPNQPPSANMSWKDLLKEVLQNQVLCGTRKKTGERFAVNCDARDIETKSGRDFVVTNWTTWSPEDGDGEDLRQQEPPAREARRSRDDEDEDERPRKESRKRPPADDDEDEPAPRDRKRPKPREDDEDEF